MTTAKYRLIKRCLNCHQNNLGDAEFCRGCGALLFFIVLLILDVPKGIFVLVLAAQVLATHALRSNRLKKGKG